MIFLVVLALPSEVYVDHPFIFLSAGGGPGRCSFWAGSRTPSAEGKAVIFVGKFIVVGPVSLRSFRCRKPALRTPGATALLPKVQINEVCAMKG